MNDDNYLQARGRRSLLCMVLALVAVCMLIVMPLFDDGGSDAASIVDSGPCGDNVTYVLDSDGLLIISGSGDMWDYTQVGYYPETTTAPWKDYCCLIKVVEIEEGVTSIGSCAFLRCTLVSVTLPLSIISINWSAFEGCTSLLSVTIPEGVTSIAASLFYECTSLTSITIPEGVTSIGVCAFEGCTSLLSVTIPEGVTSIGACSFRYCNSLISVVIPSTVTYIGSEAFWNCFSITSLIISEGVTSIGEYAFWGCSSITSLIIPSTVNTISFEAFYGCHSLTSLKISEGVASIDYFAFENCVSLTALTIPSSVIYLSFEAFAGCFSLNSVYNLSSLTLSEEDIDYGGHATEVYNRESICTIVYEGSEYTFAFGDKGYVLARISTDKDNLSLPEKFLHDGEEVSSYVLADGLFAGMSIKSVVIPSVVKSIPNYLFQDCVTLGSYDK